MIYSVICTTHTVYIYYDDNSQVVNSGKSTLFGVSISERVVCELFTSSCKAIIFLKKEVEKSCTMGTLHVHFTLFCSISLKIHSKLRAKPIYLYVECFYFLFLCLSFSFTLSLFFAQFAYIVIFVYCNPQSHSHISHIAISSVIFSLHCCSSCKRITWHHVLTEYFLYYPSDF